MYNDNWTIPSSVLTLNVQRIVLFLDISREYARILKFGQDKKQEQEGRLKSYAISS